MTDKVKVGGSISAGSVVKNNTGNLFGTVFDWSLLAQDTVWASTERWRDLLLKSR